MQQRAIAKLMRPQRRRGAIRLYRIRDAEKRMHQHARRKGVERVLRHPFLNWLPGDALTLANVLGNGNRVAVEEKVSNLSVKTKRMPVLVRKNILCGPVDGNERRVGVALNVLPQPVQAMLYKFAC